MIVYMAINKENGKRYIGITIHSLKRRISGHVSQSKHGRSSPPFMKALRNYGAECFKWEILCHATNRENLLFLEEYFIDEVKPEYNVLPGGIGLTYGNKNALGNKGRTGRINSPLMREHISEGLKKSKKLFRKKVKCLDTGVIYNSLAEAGEKLKMDWTGIQKVCSGKRQKNLGLRFEFIKTRKIYKKPNISQEQNEAWLRRRNMGPEASSKRVFCLDDFRIFDSASAAAKHYDLSKSALTEHCSGYIRKGTKTPLRKSVGGKRFVYCDQELNMMVA